MKQQIIASLSAVAGSMLLAALAGCPSSPPNAGGGGNTPAGHDGHEGHDHGAHAKAGPLGGHLIELGRNHEHHAELVDSDDAEQISVYFLDGDMKETPIDAESVSITLTIDGQTKTYDLAAANAADGKASRFDAAGSDLFHALEDHEAAAGKLRVTIDGVPYVGEFQHDEHHDADGHEHKPRRGA